MTEEISPPTSKPDLGGTIVQGGDALAAARELSAKATAGPGETTASPTAPRIPGYTLAGVLGRGSFATAWKAVQARTGKTVAVKVFHQSSGVNWLFLRREVERLVRLDKHPHVVSLLDADLAADPPYYVTDLMEGGSLERFVDPKKPMDATTVARWLEEITQALAFVHGKGIIHCDLKPANVLLDGEGRIRVADFGQARVLAEGQGALGTLFYMAPEQARLGDEGEAIQPDVRWDLYALGATAYALLTGNAPYADTLTGRLESSSSVAERLKVYRELSTLKPVLKLGEVKGLDEDLAAIVGKCLSPDPIQRYESGSAILADLAARRNRRPVSPLAHRRGYRLGRYLQRNVGWVVAAGAIVLGVGVLGWRQHVFQGRLAASLFLLRAQQAAEHGDAVTASAWYVRLERSSPSHLARANAEAYLSQLAIPMTTALAPTAVWDAHIIANGKNILAWCIGGSVGLWDAQSGQALWSADAHQGKVYELTTPPSAKYYLTSGADRRWTVLDAATGRMVGSRHGDPQGYFAASWHPDGIHILEWGSQGVLRLWRVGEDAAPQWSHDHPAGISGAAFSPDGHWLVTRCDDGILRAFDSATGRPSGPPMTHGAKISHVAFTPDGGHLVSESASGGTICGWRFANRQRVWKFVRSGSGMFEVNPKPEIGQMLVRDGDTILAVDAHSGRAVWTIKGAVPVRGYTLSPDGLRLATWGPESASVRIWNTRTGQSTGRDLEGTAAVNFTVFSPSGNKLGIVCGDAAFLWDLDTRQPAGRVIRHDSWIQNLVFHPDGSWFISFGDDRTLRTWETPHFVPDEEMVRRPAMGGAWASEDGRGLMIGTKSGWEAFDLTDSSLLSSVSSHAVGGKKPGSVAASANRTNILTLDGSSISRVWDAKTGFEIGHGLEHGAEVKSAEFSGDGSLVVTTSLDRTAKIWKSSDGTLLTTIHLPEPGGAAKFTVGSTRIATWGPSYEVRSWNVGDGMPLGQSTPIGHEIWFARVSPDGQRLVLGCADGLQILDTSSGKAVGKFCKCDGGVWGCAISPSGQDVIGFGEFATVYIVDLRTGNARASLAHGGAVYGASFDAHGTRVVTAAADEAWPIHHLY